MIVLGISLLGSYIAGYVSMRSKSTGKLSTSIELISSFGSLVKLNMTIEK